MHVIFSEHKNEDEDQQTSVNRVWSNYFRVQYNLRSLVDPIPSHACLEFYNTFNQP